MAVVTDSFFNAARNDSRIVGLAAHCDQIQKRINLQPLIDEIFNLQKKAPIFNVVQQGTVTASAERLANASASIQANRSRLIQIRMQLFMERSGLEAHRESVETYLMFQYAELIRKDFKNKEEREGAMDLMMQSAKAVSEKIQAVITLADMAVTDLDKAHFSLSVTSTILGMVNKERVI